MTDTSVKALDKALDETLDAIWHRLHSDWTGCRSDTTDRRVDCDCGDQKILNEVRDLFDRSINEAWAESADQVWEQVNAEKRIAISVVREMINEAIHWAWGYSEKVVGPDDTTAATQKTWRLVRDWLLGRR